MEHQPLVFVALNAPIGAQHQQVGSLAGAARPRKHIMGAQRSAQRGQKPRVECKGKSWLNSTLKSKGCWCESRA